METAHPPLRRRILLGLLALGIGLAPLAQAAGNQAKGSLTFVHKGKPVTVKLRHAYLVKGPDLVDPAVHIRRLVFSGPELAAGIQATENMLGLEGTVREGMTVDLVPGGELRYWLGIRDGYVQHSGAVTAAALKAIQDAPDHLAGKLSFDDGATGGARVEVEFDASLVKEFQAAR